MRSLVFAFAFLLISVLSSAPGTQMQSQAQINSESGQLADHLSFTTENPDFLATETVQPAVPAPQRALRNKQNEGPQRIGYEGPESVSSHIGGLNRFNHFKSVISLLAHGQSVLPAHDADYIKFGILVI